MKPIETSRSMKQETPAIRGFSFFNALKNSGLAIRSTNFNALKIWSRAGIKEGTAMKPIK